jgi:hypothetical protein
MGTVSIPGIFPGKDFKIGYYIHLSIVPKHFRITVSHRRVLP